MRVWYPRPFDLKNSKTSGSRRILKAFLRGGVMMTAFDQSRLIGAASGSAAAALAISSSLSASTFVQSVFPAGRVQSSSAEYRVIFSSFPVRCGSCRDEPAPPFSLGEDDNEFPAGRLSNRDPAVFAVFDLRARQDDFAEDAGAVFEIDLVLLAIDPGFAVIPFKSSEMKRVAP